MLLPKVNQLESSSLPLEAHETGRRRRRRLRVSVPIIAGKVFLCLHLSWQRLYLHGEGGEEGVSSTFYLTIFVSVFLPQEEGGGGLRPSLQHARSSSETRNVANDCRGRRESIIMDIISPSRVPGQ